MLIKSVGAGERPGGKVMRFRGVWALSLVMGSPSVCDATVIASDGYVQANGGAYSYDFATDMRDGHEFVKTDHFSNGDLHSLAAAVTYGLVSAGTSASATSNISLLFDSAERGQFSYSDALSIFSTGNVSQAQAFGIAYYQFTLSENTSLELDYSVSTTGSRNSDVNYDIGVFELETGNNIISVGAGRNGSAIRRIDIAAGSYQLYFGLHGGTNIFVTEAGENSSSTSGRLNFSFGSGAPAVPEPATWAMMLLGFGMVAGATRYRRRKATVTFA